MIDTYLPPVGSERQTDTQKQLRVVSDYIDIAFNVFFALEALFKAMTFGFVLDENSYLRESWNKLDFFIVASSLIDMAVESIDVPVIKILRLLRTLRPLRFISHNVNMKVVVVALLESVTAIFNVLIVVLLIWLMFAILGVSLLKGKLGYCDSPSLTSSYNISRIQVCCSLWPKPYCDVV